MGKILTVVQDQGYINCLLDYPLTFLKRGFCKSLTWYKSPETHCTIDVLKILPLILEGAFMYQTFCRVSLPDVDRQCTYWLHGDRFAIKRYQSWCTEVTTGNHWVHVVSHSIIHHDSSQGHRFLEPDRKIGWIPEKDTSGSFTDRGGGWRWTARLYGTSTTRFSSHTVKLGWVEVVKFHRNTTLWRRMQARRSFPRWLTGRITS